MHTLEIGNIAVEEWSSLPGEYTLGEEAELSEIFSIKILSKKNL